MLLILHAQWRFRVGVVPNKGYNNTWACFEEHKWDTKNNDFAWEVPEKVENERFEGSGLVRQGGGFV